MNMIMMILSLLPQIAGMCKEDAACLVRQKTCLVMAAAASLKQATDCPDDTEKVMSK